MLRRAEKLTVKNQSQLARLPFHIVWPSGAGKLVNFTVHSFVCHHKTSPKLKLELKKETSVSRVNSLLHHNFTVCFTALFEVRHSPLYIYIYIYMHCTHLCVYICMYMCNKNEHLKQDYYN